MPSLLNTSIAANYRLASPSTKFGTRELVHLLVTVANVDLTDTETVDGNFAKTIQAVQTVGEVYAVGQPTFGEGASNVTFIISADTFADDDYNNNPGNGIANSTNIQQVLNNLFDESVTISFTVMFGLAYD